MVQGLKDYMLACSQCMQLLPALADPLIIFHSGKANLALKAAQVGILLALFACQQNLKALSALRGLCSGCVPQATHAVGLMSLMPCWGLCGSLDHHQNQPENGIEPTVATATVAATGSSLHLARTSSGFQHDQKTLTVCFQAACNNCWQVIST